MRVAGFGFRSAAGLDSLRAAYALAGGDADVLATVEDKLAGMTELARDLDLPLLGVSRAALAACPRQGSEQVAALYGTGSVAEASALVAAGKGARLVKARVTSPDGMAVVAIAEGPGA